MKEEIRFSFGKGTGGEISGWAKVSEIVNHKARFIKDGGDKRFFNEIVELTVIPQFENEPQMIEDWFCINMLDCFNNTDIVRLDVVEEITETAEEIFEPEVIKEIENKLSEIFEPDEDDEQKSLDEDEAYLEEEFRNAVIDGLNDRDS